MSNPKASDHTTQPATKKTNPVQTSESQALKALDRATKRISNTNLQPDPYFVTVNGSMIPSAAVGNRWINQTPFSLEEGYLQYQSFLYRSPSDSLLRAHPLSEIVKMQAPPKQTQVPEAEPAQGNTASTSTASTANTPAAPKKKISLSDYHRSKAAAAAAAAATGGQAPGNQDLRKETLKKELGASFKLPPSIAEDKPAANSQAKNQPDASSSTSNKRAATEISTDETKPSDPESHQAKKQRLESHHVDTAATADFHASAPLEAKPTATNIARKRSTEDMSSGDAALETSPSKKPRLEARDSDDTPAEQSQNPPTQPRSPKRPATDTYVENVQEEPPTKKQRTESADSTTSLQPHQNPKPLSSSSQASSSVPSSHPEQITTQSSNVSSGTSSIGQPPTASAVATPQPTAPTVKPSSASSQVSEKPISGAPHDPKTATKDFAARQQSKKEDQLASAKVAQNSKDLLTAATQTSSAKPHTTKDLVQGGPPADKSRVAKDAQVEPGQASKSRSVPDAPVSKVVGKAEKNAKATAGEEAKSIPSKAGNTTASDPTKILTSEEKGLLSWLPRIRSPPEGNHWVPRSSMNPTPKVSAQFEQEALSDQAYDSWLPSASASRDASTSPLGLLPRVHQSAAKKLTKENRVAEAKEAPKSQSATTSTSKPASSETGQKDAQLANASTSTKLTTKVSKNAPTTTTTQANGKKVQTRRVDLSTTGGSFFKSLGIPTKQPPSQKAPQAGSGQKAQTQQQSKPLDATSQIVAKPAAKSDPKERTNSNSTNEDTHEGGSAPTASEPTKESTTEPTLEQDTQGSGTASSNSNGPSPPGGVSHEGDKAGWRAQADKLNEKARALKREAQAMANKELESKEPNERNKKVAALKIVQAMAYFLRSFDLQNKNVADLELVWRNWRGMIPLAMEARQICEGFQEIKGMALFTGMVACLELAEAFARVQKAGLVVAGSDLMQDVTVEQICDNQTRLTKWATEMSRLLPRETIAQSYPKTHQAMGMLPLGLTGDPSAAASAVFTFLGEWTRKEKLAWKPQL